MILSTMSRLFRALTLRARVRLLLTTHPVSAVISLVQVFVARGRFLRTIGLDFFTFTYIVIYVGAIAVLFLFVIMLLDTQPTQEISQESSKNSKSSWLFFLLRIRARTFWRRFSRILDSDHSSLSRFSESWNLEEVDRLPVAPALGSHLYTTYRTEFILRALILLVAIVGSIQISFSGTTFGHERRSQTIFQQMARQENKTLRR